MLKYTNSPYKDIPKELINNFTLNNKIPILYRFCKSNAATNGVKWTTELIEEYKKRFTPDNIKNIKEGKSSYGHHSCICLLKSFEKYDVRNKRVAVIGSESPWIEAILLNLGNTVTTIEYNVPECNFENLECKDYFDYFINNTDLFDVIVSYSSIEHSGLGRYGDPLDPDGDIKTMEITHKNLKEDGLLIWGGPVGHDALVWNAHRIYGKIRLPLIFKNFKELEWIGFKKEKMLNQKLQNNSNQPVIILRKN